ncbi:MAG: SgcJ/EcaC family oxidoreductase [Bacteroidota bacterium]
MHQETPFAIAEPEDIPRAFVVAWNAHRANQLAALFEEDAEFVNVVGLWWHDQAAIYRAHEYGLRVIFKDSQAELRRTTVKYLTEEIAVVHARMKLTGQTPQAGVEAPGPRFNVFSFVVRKHPEGWPCASAHNTDVVPGAETNITRADGSLGHADYRE